mmetsp:Transcript_21317/g.46289  ORF Transcript_21317/g.46289 Transcript_21317/m.46289 type:complete len:224 (-) Transcript_21317:129-800(-)
MPSSLTMFKSCPGPSINGQISLENPRPTYMNWALLPAAQRRLPWPRSTSWPMATPAARAGARCYPPLSKPWASRPERRDPPAGTQATSQAWPPTTKMSVSAGLAASRTGPAEACTSTTTRGSSIGTTSRGSGDSWTLLPPRPQRPHGSAASTRTSRAASALPTLARPLLTTGSWPPPGAQSGTTRTSTVALSSTSGRRSTSAPARASRRSCGPRSSPRLWAHP